MSSFTGHPEKPHVMPLPNIRIGTVGFDRIVLTEVMDRTDPWPEPLMSLIYGIQYDTSKEKDLIKTPDGYTIRYSQKRLSILAPDWELVLWNHHGHPFSKLEIHASREGEVNLQNLFVEEVLSRYKEIGSFIWKSFDLRNESGEKIHLTTDISQIHIYSAEINITIPLLHAYSSYKRVYEMMASACKSDSSKRGKVFGKDDKIETYYIQRGATKKTVIYSKTIDIKERFGISCDVPLLRYEMSLQEQILAMILGDRAQSAEYKMHLADLTQPLLEEYFNKLILTLYENMDKKLTQFSSDFQKDASLLTSTALLQAARLDNISLMEAYLNTLYGIETEKMDPQLLDIDDLINMIDKSKFIDEIKILLKSAISRIKGYTASVSLSSFIDQRQRYEELRYRLYHPHIYNFTYYEQEKLLVWWDNPAHESIDISVPNSFGGILYHLLVNRYSVPKDIEIKAIPLDKNLFLYLQCDRASSNGEIVTWIKRVSDAFISECMAKATDLNKPAQPNPATDVPNFEDLPF